MTTSVESIVAAIAADVNAHPFGASYVARKAGIDVAEAYRQLEDLATRHDLDRHFELISPLTGRSLQGFHLGDKVPIGEVCEPPEDDEEPFTITENDIWVTFSPTAQFRREIERKKKQAPPQQQLLTQTEANLLRAVRELQQVLQQGIGEAHRRIRSEARRLFTSRTRQ